MKFKLTPKKAAIFTILLFVVSVTLALCLAACDKDEPDDKKGNTHNGDGSIATSADYTYKTDISAVADALNTTDVYYLTLANKSYNLGAEFLPDELVEVARKYCVDEDVKEGEIFVMGDHRNDSYDSRDPRVGMISVDSVLGKVLFRFYPFDKFGAID